MIRRYGDPKEPGKSYTVRHGVYAILPRDGQLLLTFQAAPGPELQLPGGGIDPNEHALPALHREVFEETGWKIGAVRKLGVFRRFTFMPDYDLWAEKICHIYTARPIRAYGPPTEAGHSAVWMSPEQAARSLGNAGDRAFVRAMMRG